MRRRFRSAPDAPLAGRAITALVSLVSPLDAVPDPIPLVGVTAAVGVLAMAFAQLATELRKSSRPDPGRIEWTGTGCSAGQTGLLCVQKVSLTFSFCTLLHESEYFWEG